MRTATDIIEGLGGTTKVATALGLPITTVHSWTRFNAIPIWRHAALVTLARSLKKPLKVADFPARTARKAMA